MLKKFVCLLAALAIVLSLLPATVSAEQFTDYYGRSVLSDLPNSEALLYAYDRIAEAAEAHAEEAVNVYDGTHPLSSTELDTVFDVYRRDYAHHFWLGNSYKASYNDQTVLSVTLSYIMTAEQTSAAKEEFEAQVKAILDQITPSMSQFDIALLFHDRIAEKVTYVTSENAHNAYGALVEGVAVCEGYSEAFQYLLHRAGIASFLAIGTSVNVYNGIPEGHEWNYIKIDGKWYQTDVTWDDQGDVFHMYFNLSDAKIAKDHTATPTAYPLPKCDSEDAFYYTVKPGFLSTFEVSAVADLLKAGKLTARVYAADGADSFIRWYSENISAIAAAAGVYGAFAYGYSFLGNEVAVYIKQDGLDDVTPGDVNGDGDINAKDIMAIMRSILGRAPAGFIEAAADFNNDGDVNAKDIMAIMRHILNNK